MESKDIEIEINEMPHLRDIPEEVMEIFISSLLEEILKMCEVE